jgi:hypothetical protein
MNTLPTVLEDIIMSHKKFLDHQERNKNILKDIKSIYYHIDSGRDSWRDMYRLQGKRVQCYGGINYANLICDSVYEVWIHTYDEEDEEEIKVIYEEYGVIDIIDASL